MKRLTSRMADGTAVMAWEHEEQHSTNEWVDMLQTRLAAYEDTGLEPEEVEIMRESKADAQFMLTELCRFCDYDRLEELAHAEQEGRLVVLLCEPWPRPFARNTVYIIEHGEVVEDYVTEVIVGADLTGKLSVMYYTFDGFAFLKECIGKTLFRTEEEAKASLKGDSGNG